MAFQAQLETFHGPLDLLLYLVRKEEVEIAELPLAEIAEQYLAYVELLEQIDVNGVGEFLDIASALIELKSRKVLPQAVLAADEVVEPQSDLVHRLLEYQQYRLAAENLEQRHTEWRQRRPRSVEAPATPSVDPLQQPLEGIELWDLVSAFARLRQERVVTTDQEQTVLYDETPVQQHMATVYERLVASRGSLAIGSLFETERVHKSTWIGVFLAVLELVRHRHALAEQPVRYGAILLTAGPEPYPPLGAEEPAPSQ